MPYKESFGSYNRPIKTVFRELFLETIFTFRALMRIWETNVGSECVIFLYLALFGLLILFSRLAGVCYLPELQIFSF